MSVPASKRERTLQRLKREACDAAPRRTTGSGSNSCARRALRHAPPPVPWRRGDQGRAARERRPDARARVGAEPGRGAAGLSRAECRQEVGRPRSEDSGRARCAAAARRGGRRLCREFPSGRRKAARARSGGRTRRASRHHLLLHFGLGAARFEEPARRV